MDCFWFQCANIHIYFDFEAFFPKKINYQLPSLGEEEGGAEKKYSYVSILCFRA
jgi:hypothetical protein